MKIVRTHPYERKVSKLLSAAEIQAAEDEIVTHPERWPVVQGTGGIRKARAAKGSTGKSGGARIMYYFWSNKGRIYLLDIYAKNEKEDITAADKKKLRDAVQLLKEIENES